MTPIQYEQAVDDFHQARRKAATEEFLARLRRQPVELLNYDAVRDLVGGAETDNQHLQDIPIDAIVGSVNRFQEFTRSFLPRREDTLSRWASVRLNLAEARGFPPVKVYQIATAYFVIDGHHRISVARQAGAKTVPAYVTEVQTRIPFDPDEPLEKLILRTEQMDFLDKTRFDELRPNEVLEVSEPGRYPQLLEHIQVHRYFMGLDQKRPVGMREAVEHWFETLYLPLIWIVRERGVLREFPDRTETDLYLWVMEHREALREAVGWDVSPEAAANDLIQKHGGGALRWAQRLGQAVVSRVLPAALEAGPEPGEWRRHTLGARRHDRMFNRILVTVPPGMLTWSATDIALQIALKEDAWLGGLRVYPAGQTAEDTLEEDFCRRLGEAGIAGKLVTEVGKNAANQILLRARWVDLVVTRMVFPPPLRLFSRLASGMRLLIRRSPTPLLLIPDQPREMKTVLLAFDDSPRASEALFMAAYLALRWQMRLTVITAHEDVQQAKEICLPAVRYLVGREIEADFLYRSGPADQAILKAVDELGIDLLVMGGYSKNLMRELFTKNTIDRVLQKICVPVLICR